MNTQQPAPGRWTAALNRSLLLGCAFWIGLWAVASVGELAGGFSRSVLVPVAIAIAGQFVMTGCCLIGAQRRSLTGLVATGAVGGLMATVASLVTLWPDQSGLTTSARLTIPTSALQALQVWILATFVSPRRAVLSVLATAPIYLLVALPVGQSGYMCDQWVVVTAGSLTLGAFLRYLKESAAAADRLDAATESARREDAARRAVEESAAVAQRVIHDHVISALRSIEQGLPTEIVRSACRSARAALLADGPCRTQTQLHQRLAATTQLPVLLHGPQWSQTPPAHVLDAISGAGGEAIRNAKRHSGASELVVDLGESADEIWLTIRDNGIGIGSATPGTGITGSIVERMAAIGGEAVVMPADNGGTLVRLTWPWPRRPTPEHITPFSSQRRMWAYFSVAVPLLCGHVYMAARFPGAHPAGAAALAASAAITVLIGAYVFARRPARWTDQLWVTPLTAAQAAIGLSIAGNGALLDYRAWVVSFVTGLLLFMAFESKPSYLLLPVGTLVALMVLAAAGDPTVGTLEPVGWLASPIVYCGFSSLFGVLLRRSTHEIRSASDELAKHLEEAAWLDTLDRAYTVHLATLTEEVAPLLDSVIADGPDAQTLLDARVLHARCRDEIVLQSPLPTPLREALAHARARGMSVNFRADESRVTWQAPMSSLLGTILAIESVRTVTVMQGTRPRIVVLPALGAEVIDALSRSAIVTSDVERTSVRPLGG